MKKQEEVKRGPKRSQQDGIRRKPGKILKKFRRIEVGKRSVIRKEAVRTRSGEQGRKSYLFHLLSTGVHVTLAPPGE